ncbi:hypothetical protein PMAC_002189 [Pneumocystis sp. 'macacae']|nr:hypothetical protein PMAC_002189 [Pneumocystis sp. 'macacae']
MDYLYPEAKRLKDLLYDAKFDSSVLNLLPSAFDDFFFSISDSTKNTCLRFLPELIQALYLPIDSLPNIKVLEKLLSPMSWEDLVALDLVPHVFSGLACGNEEIELFCLRMLSKSTKTRITSNTIDKNMINRIISCMSSRYCSCANKAIDLSSSGDISRKRLLSCFSVLSLVDFFSLENPLSKSTIISRFFTLILKLSSQSYEMFKSLVSSGLIDNVINLSNSDDLLIRLCKIDFLSSLLTINYTFDWFENNGYIKEAVSPFLAFEFQNIDLDTELLIIQSCKFIESMKYISFKDFQKIDSFNNLVFKLVENLSLKTLSSSLYKANLFTIAGMFSFSNDFSKYIYFRLTDLPNLTKTDNGLNALELILLSPSEEYTELFFEQKLSSKAIYDIMISAKSPFESTRYSALLVLRALVKHLWGISKCVGFTSLMEFILSRTVEEYFDRMIKYEIVKIMAETGRHLLGSWEEKVLQYVMKGPFVIDDRFIEKKNNFKKMVSEKDYISSCVKLAEVAIANNSLQDIEYIIFDVFDSFIVKRNISEKIVSSILFDIQKLDTSFNIENICLDNIWLFQNDGHCSEISPDGILNSLTILLNELLSVGLVSMEIARERLESNLLVLVSAISNHVNFTKKAIRINTSLLYKQTKFNLIREENEGYSKLIVEVNFFLQSDILNNDKNMTTFKIEHFLNNITSLIGFFDLDSNRVLDILLTVASQNLIYHWKIFIELFSISSWWCLTQSRFNLEDMTSFEKRKRLNNILEKGVQSLFDDIECCSGSKIASQLLGFKLKFYNSLENKENLESLFMLIALLIKYKLLNIGDILPYLSPSDNAILMEWKSFNNSLEEKAFKARGNALSMAGALTEDDTLKDKVDKENNFRIEALDSSVILTFSNEKLIFLAFNSLLSVGSLPHVIYMFSEFPFLCGPYPDLADLLHKIIHYMISDIYNNISPLSGLSKNLRQSLFQEKKKNSDIRLRDSSLIITQSSRIKLTLDPLPVQIINDSLRKFFYDDYAMNVIPVCETYQDFHKMVVPVLRFSGLKIYRDIKLLCKICRIGRAQIKEEHSSQVVKELWKCVIRGIVLPALSMIQVNPGVVNEIYDLIKFYSYSERYAFYGEWNNVIYKIYPELKIKVIEVEKETKSILRRISKTNVRQFGRILAKVSHANPCIIFSVALNQIESYDNLVDVVVDAARYITIFGYDVLTFILLVSLSNENKKRLKEDGTSIAHWLQGLASFCGRLFKRYSNMDPTTVIFYIFNQLKISNTFDLIVLKELIAQMAGILPPTNLSESQLQGLAGGEYLKQIAMSLIYDSKTISSKSSLRLLRSLIESNLAGPLLILIAQQKLVCIYRMDDNDPHLKLLANLLDECQNVLVQYVEFLAINLDFVSFSKLLPTISDMCLKYGIEPAVAFYISRTKINEEIKRYYANEDLKKKHEKLLEEKKCYEKKVCRNFDNSINPFTRDIRNNNTNIFNTSGDLEEGEELDDDNKLLSHNNRNENYSDIVDKSLLNPVLVSLVESITDILPKEFRSPWFYVTFWQLQLYDIYVPINQYEVEMNKMRSTILTIDQDRSDGPSQRKKEKDLIVQKIEKCQAELNSQISSYENTRKRIFLEKDIWFSFASVSAESNSIGPTGYHRRIEVINHLIQYCFLPRCLFSPNDSTYCAKFIRLIHFFGTPNFSTLTLYDRLFGDYLPSLLFICTQQEAENFGRFLREILADLFSWYKDEAVYNKEAKGTKNLPGFQKRWSSGFRDKFQEHINDDDMLQYEEFKRLMYKWHRKLNQVFKICLDSKEYMHLRNSIIVLEKISECFPIVSWMGRALKDKVSFIIAQEKREDLKVRALGYRAKLIKGEFKWMSINQFQKMDASPGHNLSSDCRIQESTSMVLTSSGNNCLDSEILTNNQNSKKKTDNNDYKSSSLDSSVLFDNLSNDSKHEQLSQGQDLIMNIKNSKQAKEESYVESSVNELRMDSTIELNYINNGDSKKYNFEIKSLNVPRSNNDQVNRNISVDNQATEISQVDDNKMLPNSNAIIHSKTLDPDLKIQNISDKDNESYFTNNFELKKLKEIETSEWSRSDDNFLEHKDSRNNSCHNSEKYYNFFLEKEKDIPLVTRTFDKNFQGTDALNEKKTIFSENMSQKQAINDFETSLSMTKVEHITGTHKKTSTESPRSVTYQNKTKTPQDEIDSLNVHSSRRKQIVIAGELNEQTQPYSSSKFKDIPKGPSLSRDKFSDRTFSSKDTLHDETVFSNRRTSPIKTSEIVGKNRDISDQRKSRDYEHISTIKRSMMRFDMEKQPFKRSTDESFRVYSHSVSESDSRRESFFKESLKDSKSNRDGRRITALSNKDVHTREKDYAHDIGNRGHSREKVRDKDNFIERGRFFSNKDSDFIERNMEKARSLRENKDNFEYREQTWESTMSRKHSRNSSIRQISNRDLNDSFKRRRMES